jgi:lipopolysaccharide/colanic/teichoic acid biosynthesis glycosyltransferase
MLSGKTAIIFDACFGFYSEDYFREMLVMERRRTERSQKPFLFVLVNINSTHKFTRDSQFSRKIKLFIQASTREIDIKGWYDRHRTIGIIYTEYNPQAKETILAKIRTGLDSAFGAELAKCMTISSASFPEEIKEPEKEEAVADPRFYPSPHKRIESNKGARVIKRCIDVVGSLIGILLLSPFFIIVPIIIKCTSKGPVFFTQKRVGQGGRLFTFLKFRSMRVQKDCSVHKEFIKQFIQRSDSISKCGGQKIFKMKNDPRVTPIGKFIRKTSIDELPQLFNVLIGNMSLVGPRPAIPYEVEEYDTWHKRRVLEVKPGITGYWQVNGRSKTSFEVMVRMDLQYIKQWSLAWDIKLICQTPFAVFKGAY